MVETIIVIGLIGWFGYKVDSDAKFKRKVKNILRWRFNEKTNKKQSKSSK